MKINLRKILNEKDITITALSARTEISRSTLSQLVNNDKLPETTKLETLIKISKVLNVSLFELISEEEKSFSFSLLDEKKVYDRLTNYTLDVKKEFNNYKIPIGIRAQSPQEDILSLQNSHIEKLYSIIPELKYSNDKKLIEKEIEDMQASKEDLKINYVTMHVNVSDDATYKRKLLKVPNLISSNEYIEFFSKISNLDLNNIFLAYLRSNALDLNIFSNEIHFTIRWKLLGSLFRRNLTIKKDSIE